MHLADADTTHVNRTSRTLGVLATNGCARLEFMPRMTQKVRQTPTPAKDIAKILGSGILQKPESWKPGVLPWTFSAATVFGQSSVTADGLDLRPLLWVFNYPRRCPKG